MRKKQQAPTSPTLWITLEASDLQLPDEINGNNEHKSGNPDATLGAKTTGNCK